MISPGCRVHGPACRIPWGYDEAHTDQPGRPYTLDQLAERREPPMRFAYADYDSYIAGFHLWRVLRRDAEPTVAERLAADAVRIHAHPGMRGHIEQNPDAWPEMAAALNDLDTKDQT